MLESVRGLLLDLCQIQLPLGIGCDIFQQPIINGDGADIVLFDLSHFAVGNWQIDSIYVSGISSDTEHSDLPCFQLKSL